jgi:hypothetical protein
MNPLLLELLPWAGKGQCCSQLVLRLALQCSGEDNPSLVRSLWGLCQGMAQNGQTCGILSGGVVALSYYAGLGENGAHPMAVPLISDFVEWFNGLPCCAGGNACPSVAGRLLGLDRDADPPPDLAVCGELLAQAWEKLVELLTGYGIDLTVPPA